MGGQNSKHILPEPVPRRATYMDLVFLYRQSEESNAALRKQLSCGLIALQIRNKELEKMLEESRKEIIPISLLK